LHKYHVVPNVSNLAKFGSVIKFDRSCSCWSFWRPMGQSLNKAIWQPPRILS